MDKRLGKKNADGELAVSPTVSISGAALPDKPYTTVGLSNGYFVVLDTFISDDNRDELLAELRGIVQSYAKPSKKKSDSE